MCCPADCCRRSETVLESFTTVFECCAMECVSCSVVPRRAWRSATVCSLEAENGCRLAAAMSSGMEVALACNVDSTVGGTSDGFSDMMIRWWWVMMVCASQQSERDTECTVVLILHTIIMIMLQHWAHRYLTITQNHGRKPKVVRGLTVLNSNSYASSAFSKPRL